MQFFRTFSVRPRLDSAHSGDEARAKEHKVGDATSKSARARLAPRREPYWVQIDRGFLSRLSRRRWNLDRPTSRSRRPTAVPLARRVRGNQRGERARRPLAHPDRPRRPPCAVARHRARCPCKLRAEPSLGRRATAWDAGQRFRLTVGRNIAFGRMRLEDVRREDVERWRDGLRRGRLPRSVNRQVRASMRQSTLPCQNTATSSPPASELELCSPMPRKMWPRFDQRAKTRQRASSAPLAALLIGYTHTGARPSELAEATVADFDASAGTITLRHRKGRGAKLRSRAVMLSDEGITFFQLRHGVSSQRRLSSLAPMAVIGGLVIGRSRSGPLRTRLTRHPEKLANASLRTYLRIRFATHGSASSCSSTGSIRLRLHSSAARAC